VIDRASTFADPELLALLREHFVPVAIDQAYQRRQQDPEGEFYRRIAGQGPRHDFRGTTQGFYVATAAGELLLYNNNRDPPKVRRLLREALQQFRASAAATAGTEPVERGTADPRYSPQPPAGGLVLRVHAKVLGGYGPAADEWQRILQGSLGRDNLWVTRTEHEALVRGEVPRALALRLARFHLVDNTRGEPPMWSADEVRELRLELADGRVAGEVRLATDDRARSYRAALRGRLRIEGGQVRALELIADGWFRGQGQYTGGAPPGEFPFAVAFTLADGSDVADGIPPQGSRGWVEGYLR
jgi:hypothetical protein